MARTFGFIVVLAALTPSLRADGPTTRPGNFPARVHVYEDFETDIEKRWWHRGMAELKDLPPSTSALPNTRAWRSGESNDFDDLQGVKAAKYGAVIFNPVPGPPMGPNTRLGFRFLLKDTSTLRVQIYSLSNGYHRMLVLKDLPRGTWTTATVDMTHLRRPDGTGGPLAADERIDDIQFYVDPKADPGAEATIDDIVLYDVAPGTETEPFPTRIVFTGWFDTGKQGKIGSGAEWPGDFEIVPHERPRTWKAARSVVDPETKQPWIRVGLRGMRPLPPKLRLRFDYRLTAGDGPIIVRLPRPGGGSERKASLDAPAKDQWARATLDLPAEAAGQTDQIQFLAPAGASLLVDDVMLYEPAAAK